MSSVENAAVSMTFDSAGFERGVAGVMASLENLKTSLDFSASQNAFAGLQAEADSFNLGNMDAALDSINSKFSALGAVAFTVLQEMTQSAVAAGKQMFDATIGQISTGGKSRSLAIEQAKFLFRGLGQDVEASMESALEAVRGTAYGLDEAATVAASFGASGITAGAEMTGALRGVAGVAALTNTSFAEMGSIFQDVAGFGRLTGAHLFSFSSRGINMAAQLGQAWGMTQEEVKAAATAGNISFQEFAATTNRLFGEHATKANETYTGSLANMRAALNRLGEDIWAPRLEATRNVFNAMSPAIDRITEGLQPLIKVWTRFVNAGAINTVDFLNEHSFVRITRMMPHIARGFQNLYHAAKSIIRPIKEAFASIFPVAAGKRFEELAIQFKQFTASLKINKETAETVRQIFQGLFSVFSIGFNIVKEVVKLFFDIGRAIFSVSGGAANFAAGLGSSIKDLKESLVDGGGLAAFFDRISQGITTFIKSINIGPAIDLLVRGFNKLKEVFSDIFGGGKNAAAEGATQVSEAFDRIQQRMDSLFGSGSALGSVIGALVDIFGEVAEAGRAAFEYLQETFAGLGEAIGSSLNEGDFDEALDVLNVGLLGGIALALKKFFDEGTLSIDLTGGVLQGVTDVLNGLTETLGALQAQIRADTLMKIAKAVGILTISVVALSLIDSVALTKALTAMAVGFGQLVGSMAVLNAMTIGPGGAARLVGLAAGLAVMGVAMIGFAIAVAILSTLDLGDIIKGINGVGAMLLGLTLAAKPLSANAPGMISAGIAIIAIGIALNIIALAVKSMAELSWMEMIQGLQGVGVALLVVAGAARLMPTGLPAIGAGLILVSLALIAISLATMMMSTMDWPDMARGLVGLGGALLILAGAAHAMTGAIAGAAAIAIMSGALLLLSVAMQSFGDMDWGDLGMSLLAMASALTVLGLAALVLTPVVPTMALLGLALIPLSIGLKMLGGAMKTLGSLSWSELGKGLLALAAGLAVLGIAALLMSPVILQLIGLGAALALLGIGMVGIGAGAYLLARAFQIISETSAAARQAVVDFIAGILELIPVLAADIAEGLVALIDIILTAAPEIIEGLITIIEDLLEGFIEIAPKFQEALVALIDLALSVFAEKAPDFIQSGIEFILSLLTGIRNNIHLLVTVVGDIIVQFLGAMEVQVPRIVQAGARLIIAFINGLGQNLNGIVNAVGNLIVRFINTVSGNLQRIINAGANLIIKFAEGLGKNSTRIINAGVKAVEKFLEGLPKAAGQVVLAVGKFIAQLIAEVSSAIGASAQEIEDIAYQAGYAIGDAFASGIGSAENLVSGVAQGLLDGAKDIFANPVGTPFRAGATIAESFAAGLDTGREPSANSARGMLDKAVAALNEGLDAIDMMSPTITPTLDLSGVVAGANDLGGILSGSAVNPDISYSRAAAILSETRTDTDEAASQTNGSGIRDVIFEQTINSPRELSQRAIYRQTRSQIAMAKDELEVV